MFNVFTGSSDKGSKGICVLFGHLVDHVDRWLHVSMVDNEEMSLLLVLRIHIVQTTDIIV